MIETSGLDTIMASVLVFIVNNVFRFTITSVLVFTIPSVLALSYLVKFISIRSDTVQINLGNIL